MSAMLANSANKEVQLQPGDAVRVQFVLIVATRRGADLSYKINNLIAVLENNTWLASRRTSLINPSEI
jgi:hypothetical protein